MALDPWWPARRTFDLGQHLTAVHRTPLQLQECMRGAAIIGLILKKETYSAFTQTYRSTKLCTVGLVWFLVLKQESNWKLHGPLGDRRI